MFTATERPARSFADFTGLSFFTRTPVTSAPTLPLEAAPLTTDFTGTPLVCASIREVVLLKPNWNWPLTTPGMIAAPPCAVTIFSSIPRAAKNPFFCPRYSGATSTMGITPTVTCVFFAPPADDESPPPESEEPHPAAPTRVTAATASPSKRLCMGPS